MLFVLSLVLAFAFSYFCGSILKKRPYIFYLLAAAVSVTASAVTFHGLPAFVNTYIIGMFSRGAFATALWAVVMWTGALKNGSKLIKRLMPIRGELSILAAILTLGHNIGFGKTYFARLFTDAGSMPPNQRFASGLTVIMLVIMLPLTVISFPSIRKKINPKKWKKIQRTAYLFYTLIYLHVMTLFLPYAVSGRSGYALSVAVYSVVFIGYAVCRIRKWYLIKHKDESRVTVNSVCTAAFAVITAMPLLYIGVNTVKAEVPSYTSPEDTDLDNEQSNSETSSSAVSSSAESNYSEISDVYLQTEKTEQADSENVASSIPEDTESSAAKSEIPSVVISSSAEQSSSAPTEQTSSAESVPMETTPSEPEVKYIYANGTYSAKSAGYDGDVKVNVTIENDRIISITGTTYESDPWYYDNAFDYVVPQIISSQNTQVDAFSGATYSSDGIMEAVAKALEKAKQ